MAFTLTIAGVPQEIRRGTLRISRTANGRATAVFSIISTDGTYRPALDAEVILTEDDVRSFGGIITRVRERGLVEGARPGIVTEVTAADFHSYTDRRIVYDGGFPAGFTLIQALTDLIPWLEPWDVTLHPSQETGPTLPELLYPVRSLTEVLNELAKIVSTDDEPWIWQIDEYKRLRVFQPSTEPAPFDLDGNFLPEVHGDIEVEPTREHYANRIIARMPEKKEVGRVEVFTGDGTTTEFTLQYTVENHRGYVGSTTTPDLYETLTTPEYPGSATWTLDPATNTITRNEPVPDGETVAFTFDGSYKATAIATHAECFDPNIGPWERVITVEDVPSETTLQAIAEAELALAVQVKRSISYKTRSPIGATLRPGQQQTITVPLRNLDTTVVITDVVTRDIGPTQLEREVKAVFDARSNLGTGWRDVYKAWLGDKMGGGAAAATTSGPAAPGMAGGAAPPDWSNQFRRPSGMFGGNAAWLFREEFVTVLLGLNHAPAGSTNLLIGEGHTVL